MSVNRGSVLFAGWIVFAGLCLGQNGQYRGPGNLTLPGAGFGGCGNDPPPPSQQRPRQVMPDLSSWIFWWEFNKDQYLKFPRKPLSAELRAEARLALQKVLEEESDENLLAASLIALAKTGEKGDRRLAESIQAELSSSNPQVAEASVLALGILGDENSIEVLIRCLKEQKNASSCPLRMRAFSAYALGLMGASSADEALKERLVDVLREALRSQSGPWKEVQVACILALGLVKDSKRRAIEDLRAILIDKKVDRLLRAHAATSLAKLGRDSIACESAFKALLTVLIDAKEKDLVRQSAVSGLGLIVRPGDEHFDWVIEQIEILAKDSRNEQERNFALISLGKIGGDKAKAFLLQQLSKNRSSSRPWVALGLGILGRNEAAAGVIADNALHQKLQEQLIYERNPSNAAACAIALGMINAEAKDSIAKVMRETREDELRGYCCVSLGMLGASDMACEIGELEEKGSRRPDFLRQALLALGEFGNEQNTQNILERLKSRVPLSTLAASAFAMRGRDSFALRCLMTNLKDSKLLSRNRAFCAAAIGILCDRSELSWNSQIAVDLNYRAAVFTLVDLPQAKGILDYL